MTQNSVTSSFQVTGRRRFVSNQTLRSFKRIQVHTQQESTTMGEEDWYKLSLIASNLPNKGWPFRTSSPYAIVKRIDGETETVLGQTEYVFHSLDPDWCKSFYFAKSAGTQIDIEEVRETQIEVEKSPMLLEITVWDYREGRRAKKIGTAVKFDPTQMIDQEVAIPIPVFCRNSK